MRSLKDGSKQIMARGERRLSTHDENTYAIQQNSSDIRFDKEPQTQEPSTMNYPNMTKEQKRARLQELRQSIADKEAYLRELEAEDERLKAAEATGYYSPY